MIKNTKVPPESESARERSVELLVYRQFGTNQECIILS